MTEDADTAQAWALLDSLWAHVDEISVKLEAAEQKSRQTRGHTEKQVRRQAVSLRRELYEAHRLIDGLHGRFPATRPRRRWENQDHLSHSGYLRVVADQHTVAKTQRVEFDQQRSADSSRRRGPHR